MRMKEGGEEEDWRRMRMRMEERRTQSERVVVVKL
jgi:hypothetical protein